MDLSTLNEPQRQAVEHVSGPLLVLAGAGSGKTRVITYRIARLIQRGVNPKHIAALTFTNKAALEMRHRVAALLPNKEDAKVLTMGTFHSLGLEILKTERKRWGIHVVLFIYDTSDQLGVVREILRRVTDTRRYDIKAILARISLAKNAFLDEDDEFPVRECDEYDEIASVVYPKYQRALRGFAAVDFDDLIYRPVKLLEENDAVSKRWSSKFRYVLVDEYQDTNLAQVRFIRTLIAEHGNLCVVGDDDQSIYSWRGADSANILGFGKAFPGATVIKLEQNYRSTSTILNAANAVIENNHDRYGKTLWSDKGDGPTIIAAAAPDTEVEAKFVAQEIITTVKEESRRYDSFAVLYRSNIQSKIIEEEFRQRDIPYVMYGGQQFFERKEVKDLIAYLRIALNPRDEISLRRIINYPSRGVGHRAQEELMRAAEQSKQTMWHAV